MANESMVGTMQVVDVSSLEQLNDGQNGVYFLLEPSTGLIFASQQSLFALLETQLGWLQMLLPVVGAAGQIFGTQQANKTAAQQAEQQKILMAQQAKIEAQRSAANTQMLMIGGGMILSGIVLYSVLN